MRHPQVAVAPGLCYGATDLPCIAQHAQTCADEWLTQLPAALLVRHSPLQRCEHPSQLMRWQSANLTLKSDPRLVEMNFGRWEMQAWDEISREELNDWSRDFVHHAPGGGENLAAVLQRVSRCLIETTQDGIQNPSSTTAWVTHAGVIRALEVICSGQGIQSASQWPNSPIAMGSIQRMGITEQALKAAKDFAWPSGAPA